MPSSKQQKGYRSNAKVLDWLLEHGFTFVWFHPHPRFADVVHVNQDSKIYAKDIFNLFDGIAIDTCGDVVFFQVKSNSWEGHKEVTKWCVGKKVKALFFNVKDRIGVEVKFINYSIT